jgi:hypothetical protein
VRVRTLTLGANLPDLIAADCAPTLGRRGGIYRSAPPARPCAAAQIEKPSSNTEFRGTSCSPAPKRELDSVAKDRLHA